MVKPSLNENEIVNPSPSLPKNSWICYADELNIIWGKMSESDKKIYQKGRYNNPKYYYDLKVRETWEKMSEKDKSPYQEKEEADKIRYENEKKEFIKTIPDIPNIPKFKYKYRRGFFNIKGWEEKCHKYYKIDEFHYLENFKIGVINHPRSLVPLDVIIFGRKKDEDELIDDLTEKNILINCDNYSDVDNLKDDDDDDYDEYEETLYYDHTNPLLRLSNVDNIIVSDHSLLINTEGNYYIYLYDHCECEGYIYKFYSDEKISSINDFRVGNYWSSYMYSANKIYDNEFNYILKNKIKRICDVDDACNFNNCIIKGDEIDSTLVWKNFKF